MELEIGLKITQTRADVTSTANLQVAKGKTGVVFSSNETETSFILSAHLRGYLFTGLRHPSILAAIPLSIYSGYRRENIEVAINEDGSQIFIGGSMPVQDKLMQRWIMQQKEVELKRFQKVFLIPKGMILDKIKVKLHEDTSTLTVFMPKSVQGLRGDNIKEIVATGDDKKQETPDSDDRNADAGHQNKHETAGKREGRDQLERAVEKDLNRRDLQKQVQYDKEQVPQTDGINKESAKEKEEGKPNRMDRMLETIKEEKLHQGKKQEFLASANSGEPFVEFQNEEGKFQGSNSTLQHNNIGGSTSKSGRIAVSESSKPTVHDEKSHLEQNGKDEIHDRYQSSESTESACTNNSAKHARHGDVSKESEPPKNRWNKCKLCDPVIAGSALLVSLLVIAVHLVRTKHK